MSRRGGDSERMAKHQRDLRSIAYAYWDGRISEGEMISKVNACYREDMSLWPGGEAGKDGYHPLQVEVDGYISQVVGHEKDAELARSGAPTGYWMAGRENGGGCECHHSDGMFCGVML